VKLRFVAAAEVAVSVCASNDLLSRKIGLETLASGYRVKDALSGTDKAERLNCVTVATWSPTGSSAKAAHLHNIERSTTAKIPLTRCFAGREWCTDCPLSVIKR
jgi:hypothetical protein